MYFIGNPVDSGGNDEGVRASVKSGAVVRNVGDTCVLASGGSAHGVSVLADELAASADKQGSSFLLLGLVVPGTGELDFHGSLFADGSYAEEECGVAGLNLCIGECADIADLSVLSFELAFLDHSVELHTCGNTCKVTALVDGSESVVEVLETLGVSLGAGSMAELNVRILLGSLDHEALMAEAVSEND